MATKTYTSDEHDSILLADQLAFRVGVQVTNTGVSADSDGRKIIKAGTPLGNASYNVLDKRDAVLVVCATTAGTPDTISPVPQGIAYRDIDVTDGATDGVMIVQGVVDLLKIDETTAGTYLTDIAKEKLPKITFVKGRAD